MAMSATGERRWRVTATVSLVLTAVLTGGCLIDRDGGNQGAGGPPPAGSSGGQPGQNGTGESLEGRFTRQTMGEYVDAVTPMITQWMEDTWASLPMPERVV